MSSVAGPTATTPPGNAPAPDAAGSGSASTASTASTAMQMSVYRTSDLRPTDVLLGRGYRYQRYPGNVALRSHVGRYRSRYVKSKRVDKRRITSEIVAYVRAGGLGIGGAQAVPVPYRDANAGGGRFLRPLSEEEVKTRSRDDCDRNDGELWTDADDRAAFEKVQHQLRQLPKKRRLVVEKFDGHREASATSPTHTATNNAGSVDALRCEVLDAPSEKQDEDVPTSPAAVAAAAAAAARADLRTIGQSSSISAPAGHLDLLSPVDIFLEKESADAMVPPDSVALDARAELPSPSCNLPKTSVSTAEINGLDEELSPTLLETGKVGIDNDESLPEPGTEQLLGQIDNFLGGVLEEEEEEEEEEGRCSTGNTSDSGALDAEAELFLPNCDLPKKTTAATTITTTEPNGINSIISPTPPIEKYDVECAPIFTEQDEKAELETLTAQDIRDVESDLRGITAGVAKLSILVEGDRVSHLLRRLDEELSRLPLQQRDAYSRAAVECPNLVNDDRKAAFLEREDNDPALAAVRLALHWQLRLEIFGPDRCFLPMTLDGAMKEEVADMVQQQTLHLLPVTDTAGRAILYLDPSRRELVAWDMEQELRWWWYFLEVAAEDPETRRSGIVLIANAANVQRQNVRGEFTSKLRTITDSASPIRLRAIHCCHARWYVPYVIYPVLKYFMSKASRLRFKPHYGSTAKLLQDLESFCLPRDRVPKALGGEVILDMKEWVESRLVLEGSRPDSHVAMEQRPIYAPDGSLSKVRNKKALPVDEKAGTAPRVGRKDSFDVAVADLYENGNLLCQPTS